MVFLAFLAVAGLTTLTWAQQQTIAEMRAARERWEESSRELERLRAEVAQSEMPSRDQAELERLRANTRDLLRLRNEVTQLRKQVTELDTLRAANADLLQAIQSARTSQSNQLALLTAARQRGAILGVNIQVTETG